MFASSNNEDAGGNPDMDYRRKGEPPRSGGFLPGWGSTPPKKEDDSSSNGDSSASMRDGDLR